MQQNTYSMRQEVSGTFGAVASSHWIATQVGMGILEKGGNAFDAAVAVGFALQVTEPQQNSLGGEAVIMAHRYGAAEPTVVCGQGVAPANATIDYYKSLDLEVVPWNGLLAAVIPGAFDAWMIMLRDYGTMSLADVLTPAIGYAANGVPVTTEMQYRIAKGAATFREHWKTTAAIYLPDDSVPEAGELFSNRELADTYARILREASSAGRDRIRQIEKARNTFYNGFVAERICSFCARNAVKDASGRSHTGLISHDDMSSWQASYERPEVLEFNGLRVFKPGWWTQGPAFLQFLGLLKESDVLAMDPLEPEYVHYVAEAFKLVYADREAWYGDALAPEIDVSVLLSEEYSAQRRSAITADASMTLRPGTIGGLEPCLPRYDTHVTGGNAEHLPPVTAPAPRPGEGDTCHIDVIDRWGNTVAATPSGGWMYGSPTVPGLGFSLSTRAQMFWLQEGLASSMKPRTRPRTTLSPTIALDANGGALAFGTRGADYQDQWNAQFFLNHLAFSMDLQQSWDAPMFHSDHWPRSDFPRDASPGKLTLEERFSEATRENLRARGHTVRVHAARRWGRGCAAKRSDKVMRAAACPSVPPSLAVAR